MTEDSDPRAETFYLATCQQCKPVLPIPFYDVDERDRWVFAHEGVTDHEVFVRTEVRPL